MIRIIAALIALLPVVAFAQLVDTFYYSPSAGCYIKEYTSGALTAVDEKRFQGVPLKAKTLKRNPQFMAYKVSGKIYLSPASCLRTHSLEGLEELETESYDERGRKDQSDYGSRLNNTENENKNDNKKFSRSTSGFEAKKFYFDLDLGITTVSGKEPTYPGYNAFDTSTDLGGGVTATSAVSLVEATKYKTKMGISLGAGFRVSPIQFLSLKLKRYSGTSSDTVYGEITYSDGSPSDAFAYTYDYKETITDILVGSKMVFMPDSNIKPVFGGYLGLSLTDTKLVDPTGGGPDIPLTSSAIALNLEGGAETMFSQTVGAGAMVGYQYVTKRKYKLKEENSNTIQGFSSLKKFSNIYLNLGLRFYF